MHIYIYIRHLCHMKFSDRWISNAMVTPKNIWLSETKANTEDRKVKVIVCSKSLKWVTRYALSPSSSMCVSVSLPHCVCISLSLLFLLQSLSLSSSRHSFDSFYLLFNKYIHNGKQCWLWCFSPFISLYRFGKMWLYINVSTHIFCEYNCFFSFCFSCVYKKMLSGFAQSDTVN